MARPTIRAIDLFCGAGGSSWGARLAGAEILAGFDMCPVAAKAYQANFPAARFYPSRIEDVNLRVVADEIGKVELILASPECTNHSPAKGKGPRCEKSKNTAFQVTRFAAAFKPRWIVVENVANMRNWTRYAEFVSAIEDLGYNVVPQVLNAEPVDGTSCNADRDRKPGQSTPKSLAEEPASEVVDRKRNSVIPP